MEESLDMCHKNFCQFAQYLFSVVATCTVSDRRRYSADLCRARRVRNTVQDEVLDLKFSGKGEGRESSDSCSKQ